MNILDIIKNQLGDEKVEQMSQHLGEDKQSTLSALGDAVPVILGGLARNAKSEEGANSLAGALDRDHDGSILENLGGLISSPESGQGQGILKHVLGGKREATEQAVAKKSGISLESAAKVFQIAAPLVMGYLGKKKKEQNLDAGSLANVVQSASKSSEEESGLGSLVSGLLDRDGDGNVMDDIGDIIGGFLGGR